MPFSGLDSRKDTPLGWMASFSGPESLKQSLQTTHHHPFSRLEWWKPSSPGTRSKLFKTRVMKTPPQVRQHAIFRTRLPKRPLVRMDGLFFGTGVTKTIPPNHPHHPFSRPESWKPCIPRSKIQAFQDSSHENTSPSTATCHFQDSTPEKAPPWDGWLVFRDRSHENNPSKPPTTTPFQDSSDENHHLLVQDPSFSGPESWKHLPKWGNMPFSGLDSRKNPH